MNIMVYIHFTPCVLLKEISSSPAVKGPTKYRVDGTLCHPVAVSFFFYFSRKQSKPLGLAIPLAISIFALRHLVLHIILKRSENYQVAGNQGNVISGTARPNTFTPRFRERAEPAPVSKWGDRPSGPDRAGCGRRWSGFTFFGFER